MINDKEVGKLDYLLPDGIFVFDVPPGLVKGSSGIIGDNKIECKANNVKEAHYVLCSRMRLVAKWKYTQVPVMAQSQEEADRLAKSTSALVNHSLPNLVLAVDPENIMPLAFNKGRKVKFAFRITNIGSGTAKDVKLSLRSQPAVGGQSGSTGESLYDKDLGEVQPGAVIPVDVSLKFDPKTMSRVCAALESPGRDASSDDNSWVFGLTQGFSKEPPPLLGTDIPNVIGAPGLLRMVSVPNVPAFRDLLSLPDLRDVVGRFGVHLDRISTVDDLDNAINGTLGKGRIDLPDIKVPDVKIPKINKKIKIPGL